MNKSALLIGGTGPTGPSYAAGLETRGFDVPLLPSGRHEVPEVATFRHVHGDVFSEPGLRDALADQSFDVVIASYGRLRSIAEVLKDRAGHLLSIGGAPVYRGFFDPPLHTPPGLPVPARADSALATVEEGGKRYRRPRAERLPFGAHPAATHSPCAAAY